MNTQKVANKKKNNKNWAEVYVENNDSMIILTNIFYEKKAALF